MHRVPFACILSGYGSPFTAKPDGDRIGALFSWTGTNISTIESKIGISFISVEKEIMHVQR